MQLFVNTSGRLQVTTVAIGTVDAHTSYVDVLGSTPSTQVLTPGIKDTKITTAGVYDLTGSPAASTSRNVKRVCLTNTGAAAITLLVERSPDGGTTKYFVRSVSLAQNEALEYDDGIGWVVYDATGAVRATASLGRFTGTSTRLSGNGTFTTGSTTTRIRLRGVGAGGGGGGGAPAVVAGGASAGGGGAAGAYGEWWIAVLPNTGYAYTSGTAGAGGAIGATGSAGTSATFVVAGVTYTCPGGAGGTSMGAAAATAANAAGGATGSAPTGGTVLMQNNGMPGDYGNRASGTIAASGAGGSSPFGPGGQAVIAQGNGLAGTGSGAGGSGGLTLNGGATQTGGNGASGGWAVEEFT